MSKDMFKDAKLKRATTQITSFSGDNRFLSNFHDAPINFNGKLWATSEHLFQALKTKDFSEIEAIRTASTPGKAKRLGRKATVMPEWDEIKQDMMLHCILFKFSQNEKLAELLIATGDKNLIEGNNWHDNFWGDCSCPKCQGIQGQNKLGGILMAVRKELITAKQDKLSMWTDKFKNS